MAALIATTTATRILLVEDSDLFRKLTRLMLATAGYTVVEAASGEAGLACYREQRYDLVITDILMADMEGLELIKALRAGDPTIRILAMSAGGHGPAQKYLELAVMFGARRTMIKPFTTDELLAAVSEVLNN